MRIPSGVAYTVLTSALCAVVAASPAVAQSQPEGNRPATYPIKPETHPRPSTRATRTPKPIVVDGRLDEAEWQLAEPLSDFVQQLPKTGHLAEFRTVVRVLYDADHVYIGATNYDPEPRKAITAGLERDFNSGNSDVFGLVLDTFHDRRNSFLFLVNPHGAVRDEQTYNDSRTIIDAWEGVITVRTSFGDSAWFAEIAIPTRTLRFDGRRNPQTWGLNFLRRVRRVNESSYWAPLDRQYRIHRMSKAGTLTGLEGLHQGRNLQLKPYALGARSTGAQVPVGSEGTHSDFGLDLKYGVTPSLTLDLTYHTDFSQVEVDQEQVNLTRFSLFFPERREFFIENAGAFTFGDVQERNYRMGSSLSDFSLFNSRRIGLTPDGRPIPIIGGGRLSGRIAGWEIGALDMRTDRTPDAPAENFAVARARRNIFGNSDAGFILLSRDASGSGSNLSYGADANIRLFGNMVINSYVAGSDARGADTTSGAAGRVSVAYRSAFWNTSAMWKRVDAGFDPGIGFVRRRAMEQSFATLAIHSRPRSTLLQEVSPYFDVNYITGLKGRLESRTLSAGTDVFFQPDGQLSFDFNDQFEALSAPFPIFTGVVIPAGGYAFREGSISYQSGQVRPLYGSIGMSGGEFYGGTRRSWNGGLTWRARYDLILEGTFQRNDVDLPEGSFLADVAGARIRYARSTKLFGSAFVQYNTQTKSFVTSARLNLRYAPLSDAFLVFTERRNRETGVRNERSVALKVTRMIAF